MLCITRRKGLLDCCGGRPDLFMYVGLSCIPITMTIAYTNTTVCLAFRSDYDSCVVCSYYSTPQVILHAVVVCSYYSTLQVCSYYSTLQVCSYYSTHSKLFYML